MSDESFVLRVVGYIEEAVDQREAWTFEARCSIYALIRSAVERDLDRQDPSLGQVAVWRHLLDVEKAIAEVEARYPTYRPQPSAPSQVAEVKPEPAIAAAPAETEARTDTEVRLFNYTMQRAERQRQHRPLIEAIHHARITFALCLHTIKHEASADPLGYMWLWFEPLIQITIMLVVFAVLRSHVVGDMPPVPFVITGVMPWLTFRRACMTAIKSGGIGQHQMNHGRVTRLHVIMSASLSMFAIYIPTAFIILFAARAFGPSEFPENLPLVLFYWGMIWLFGIAWGLIALSISLRYGGFRKVNHFTLRCMEIVSGIFFIAEDFPRSIADVLLINPVFNGLMLIRQAYFVEYDHTLASAEYFLTFVFVTFLVALCIARLDERRASIA